MDRGNVFWCNICVLTYVHPLLPDSANRCSVAPIIYLCPDELPQCWLKELNAAAGTSQRFLPTCEASPGRECAAVLLTNRLMGTSCDGIKLEQQYGPYTDSPDSISDWMSILMYIGILIWCGVAVAICAGIRFLWENGCCCETWNACEGYNIQ